MSALFTILVFARSLDSDAAGYTELIQAVGETYGNLRVGPIGSHQMKNERYFNSKISAVRHTGKITG
jgi:hypothetical protein